MAGVVVHGVPREPNTSQYIPSYTPRHLFKQNPTDSNSKQSSIRFLNEMEQAIGRANELTKNEVRHVKASEEQPSRNDAFDSPIEVLMYQPEKNIQTAVHKAKKKILSPSRPIDEEIEGAASRMRNSLIQTPSKMYTMMTNKLLRTNKQSAKTNEGNDNKTVTGRKEQEEGWQSRRDARMTSIGGGGWIRVGRSGGVACGELMSYESMVECMVNVKYGKYLTTSNKMNGKKDNGMDFTLLKKFNKQEEEEQ